MGGVCGTHRGGRNVYSSLLEKPARKTPFGVIMHRREDNIKMFMQQKRVRRRGLDQCGSVNGQLADCCEYGDEPLVSIKWGEFIDYITYC